MGFLIGLIVIATFTTLHVSSLPCAVPSLLQGNVLELVYAAGHIRQPLVVQSRFVHDAKAKRTYTHIEKSNGKSYQYYKHYDMKRQYIIEGDGSCRMEGLQGNFPSLIIPNPKHTISLPNVHVYSGSRGRAQFVISTKDQCLPTSWTEYLPLGPKFLVKQRIYYDVTTKVDLNKVKLPAQCAQSRFVLPW